MKIVLSVRSDVAYQLLTKLIIREPSLPEIEFQKRNASTVRDLEDAIEFFNADIYIVDRQLEEAESLIDILKSNGHTFYVIEDDVKAIIPILKEEYGEEVENKEIHYEKEEKQRVVVQEKIIEKEVIRTAYQAIPSKVVVVGSLYRGAGSTLLASNMARMVANRGIDVAYVEHPLIKPYMYDYFQIHRHTDKPYVDITREIHSEGIARSKRDSWNKADVKWHVIDSRLPSLSSFSYENLLVLSHTIQANVLIIDISDRWLDPEIQKFLSLADNIVMCVEPDPIKYDWSLIQTNDYKPRERRIMDYLKEREFNKLDMVLMKNVKGIDIKLVKEMLHKKPVATLPYIPYQEIQKSLFKSELLYDREQYSEPFEDNLIPLISKFVPKDFIKIENGKKNIFQKMLKR